MQLEIANLEIGRLHMRLQQLQAIVDRNDEMTQRVIEAIRNQKLDEPQSSGTDQSPRSVQEAKRRHTTSLSAFSSILRSKRAAMKEDDGVVSARHEDFEWFLNP